MPDQPGKSGLALLVAGSLILAAFQLTKVAVRRRKTAPVKSDEENIEGGEQQ